MYFGICKISTKTTHENDLGIVISYSLLKNTTFYQFINRTFFYALTSGTLSLIMVSMSYSNWQDCSFSVVYVK